ncbi:MAG TPA: GNAT family N-acetyltransferase, partial [Salinimicrobium sp.]|nr:GNAT family N-acetyltransferase [Salinimicrobium sp.]
MDIKIRGFNALSLNELYEMLRLRTEVFVVEQNCVYQDIDG